MHPTAKKISIAICGLASMMTPAACKRSGGGAIANASRAGQTVGPFRLGEAVSNRATLRLRLELGLRAKPQEIEVAGDWTATPTDVDDGMVEVACALSNVRVRLMPGPPAAGGNEDIDGHGMSRAEQEIASNLTATRFFESYRPDGAAVGLWFPRGTTPSIGNILIAIASAQQLVRPAQADSAWVVEERDANGRYVAAYRQTEPGKFVKQKARYLETNPIQATGGAALASATTAMGAGALARALTRIDRSDFELRADGAGRLLDVRGLDVLQIDFGALGLAMKVSVEVALADGRVVRDPDAVGAFGRRRGELVSQGMEQMGLDAKAERARLDREVLDGAGFDELVQALSALPPGEPAANDRRAATLARRYEALFRMDGSAAGRAPSLLLAQARAQRPERAKLVLDALSLAATPRAAGALATIARDPAMPMVDRRYALQYLSHQPELSDQAVGDVVALLDDADPQLHQMARLTYGACAATLRPSAPASARRIGDDLLTRLERTTPGSADQTDYLMAMANAGDAQALPVLRRLSALDEPLRVRTNALEAMRSIDAPEVDPLLLAQLRPAGEPSLRLATIRAIRARPVGPFAAALADLARKDPDAQIRNAAIALLGDRMTALPTLRPVLEEVGKSDGADKNRELANRYLTRADARGRSAEN